MSGISAQAAEHHNLMSGMRNVNALIRKLTERIKVLEEATVTRILSFSTDPEKSSHDCYGWLGITNGKVTAIGEETIRRSGLLWTPTFPDTYGSFQSNIKGIRALWPNLAKKAERIGR